MAAPATLKLLSKSSNVFEVEAEVMKKSGLVATLLADAGAARARAHTLTCCLCAMTGCGGRGGA